MKFSSCQFRLEQVPGIHGSFSLSCSNDVMELIYEKYYPAFRFFDLVEYSFEPFLEFAPEFCACYKSAHVEGEYCFILKSFRYVTVQDTLSKTLNYRGLSYARFTYEHRVVLRTSGKYLYSVPYLAVTAYYRVKLTVSGHFNQISAVLAKRFIILFRILAGDFLVSSNAFQRFEERVFSNIHIFEYGSAWSSFLIKQRKIHMLYADILVSELFSFLFRIHKKLLESSGGVHLVTAACDFRQFIKAFLQFSDYSAAVFTHVFQKFRDQPIILLHKSKMEMFPVYLLMTFLYTYILTVHYRALRILCVFFYVHSIASHCPLPDLCQLYCLLVLQCFRWTTN